MAYITIIWGWNRIENSYSWTYRAVQYVWDI